MEPFKTSFGNRLPVERRGSYTTDHSVTISVLMEVVQAERQRIGPPLVVAVTESKELPLYVPKGLVSRCPEA